MKEQIERMKNLMNLNENKQVYDYGCAMLYFNDHDLKPIYDMINPEDLYVEGDGFGLETEPHVTLLYGLEDSVTTEQVKEIVDKFKFGKLVAHNPSLFENDYDVLKFDIRYPTRGGAFLHKCNSALRELPYNNQYPDYHPHMTIAYLKPGMGKKYVDELKKQHGELWMSPQHAVYSQPDGTKNKINLSID